MTLDKLFTYVPLSPNSIIWYSDKLGGECSTTGMVAVDWRKVYRLGLMTVYDI